MKYTVKHVPSDIPDAVPSLYLNNLSRAAMLKAVKFLRTVKHIPFVYLGDTEIEVEHDDK